jgi:hypothetical protein
MAHTRSQSLVSCRVLWESHHGPQQCTHIGAQEGGRSGAAPHRAHGGTSPRLPAAGCGDRAQRHTEAIHIPVSKGMKGGVQKNAYQHAPTLLVSACLAPPLGAGVLLTLLHRVILPDEYALEAGQGGDGLVLLLSCPVPTDVEFSRHSRTPRIGHGEVVTRPKPGGHSTAFRTGLLSRQCRSSGRNGGSSRHRSNCVCNGKRPQTQRRQKGTQDERQQAPRQQKKDQDPRRTKRRQDEADCARGRPRACTLASELGLGLLNYRCFARNARRVAPHIARCASDRGRGRSRDRGRGKV